MDEMIQSRTTKNLMTASTIIGLILTGWFLLYAFQQGLFTSADALNLFLRRLGVAAPLAFILIQIVQVVIPIVPGGLTCAAGVLIFGPLYGFIYNYIGICIGSVLNFLLARQYGKPLVISLAGNDAYQKYAGWLEKGKKFDIFFALAIFFPVAPDDFLCLLAGLTKLSLKKFTMIILLGKPASIFLYSAGLTVILQTVIQWLHF